MVIESSSDLLASLMRTFILLDQRVIELLSIPVIGAGRPEARVPLVGSDRGYTGGAAAAVA